MFRAVYKHTFNLKADLNSFKFVRNNIGVKRYLSNYCFSLNKHNAANSLNNCWHKEYISFGVRYSYLLDLTNCRTFSSGKGDETPPPETEESDKAQPAEEVTPPTTLPASVVVPENWPHLPVIPISRNPVFPRFIKLIEV